MLLGNKKGNGHEYLGNKKGTAGQFGMKKKNMSTLKPKGQQDQGEREKKTPLER